MFGNSKGGAIYYIGLLLNEQLNHRAMIDCLIWNMLAWQEILDGSTTQEESVQFREIQMGSIGGWPLSKLKLTTKWYIKEVSGVDNTEVCLLLVLCKILTDALSGESVQYKWLQNGSQKGTIQTEFDYRMVHQGLSRNNGTGNLCGGTCRYGKDF
jgi:hypothetical protein